MTPEEWRKVDDALRYPWGRAKLRVDGYDVSLAVAALRPRRYVIVVYVNGYFRGEWITKKGDEWPEEARRFLPLKRHRLFPEARLKGLPKRSAAELRRKSYELRGYYWSSVGSLKRHFTANNSSIELVEVGGALV